MSLLFEWVAHLVGQTPAGCFYFFECPFEEQRTNGACMSAKAQNPVGNTKSQEKREPGTLSERLKREPLFMIARNVEINKQIVNKNNQIHAL